jgi:hypothetical protein
VQLLCILLTELCILHRFLNKISRGETFDFWQGFQKSLKTGGLPTSVVRCKPLNTGLQAVNRQISAQFRACKAVKKCLALKEFAKKGKFMRDMIETFSFYRL